MTTTLQQIQDRAVASSIANGLATLVSDRTEIINRIGADERALFDLANRTNRSFFARTQAITSSAGTFRSFSLAALSPPVGRILKIVLADTRELNQVDILALESELQPRYYVLGSTLFEVAQDWSAGTTAVDATLFYVFLPVPLSPLATLAQTITLPDDFADILEYKLALYLVNKDVGRDPAEVVALEKLIASRTDDFTAHITQYAGAEARAFVFPQRGDQR